MIAVPARRIYFSHPVNVYGSPLERRLLAAIADSFPGWSIVNPSEERHRQGYERYTHHFGNGMKYFFTEVLPFCDKNISLPFRDGTFGAGVWSEARFIASQHEQHWTWMILPTTEIRQVSLRQMPVLSIEETRTRIRNKDGRNRPY